LFLFVPLSLPIVVSSLKKSVAYHNWFALPERPTSDARAPFVLPEYLKMALSKSVMRNVARFRIRGQDEKHDEKHVIFSCIGTEHLRHQFIHLFDNISEGDIKGFVFQHNISAAVDLFD
jgi:hypothetical protein